MQELVSAGVFLVHALEGLVGLEESVASEHVDGFRVVDLQLFLDDHDEFEDGE